jgi:hypothetical protein
MPCRLVAIGVCPFLIKSQLDSKKNDGLRGDLISFDSYYKPNAATFIFTTVEAQNSGKSYVPTMTVTPRHTSPRAALSFCIFLFLCFFLLPFPDSFLFLFLVHLSFLFYFLRFKNGKILKLSIFQKCLIF